MTVKPLLHLARTTGRRGSPFDVRIPNALTARTLRASKAGKNVNRFGSKRELFADLGL